MNLRTAAAGLAGLALLAGTANGASAASVGGTVYSPGPSVGVSAGQVQTSSSSSQGGLNGTVASAGKSGSTVSGLFNQVSSALASKLEADAKGGAKVAISLTDNKANRSLGARLAKSGVKVHYVKNVGDVSLAVTKTGGFLSIGQGLGVNITNVNTLKTLTTALSKVGTSKFGGVDQNGVVTSPGAAPVLDKLLQSAQKSIVIKTGALNSVMLENTLARLAKRGVRVTLVLPSNATTSPLATFLENHGDKVIFAGNFQGTAVSVDSTYGFVSSGDLNYSGISRSQQVGVVFHGSGAQDLATAIGG